MQWIRFQANRFKLWLIAGGPRVTAVGFVAIAAVALALQNWSGFEYAEWKLYDQSLRLLRAVTHEPVRNDVVIIAADEASFTAFDEPFALWHRRLGALVDAMIAAEASVVGMDIVLPAKSFDTVIPGIDRALMEPLLRARGKLKLVVAQTLDDDLRPRRIFPGFVSLIGRENVASAVVCFDEDSVVRRVLPNRCGAPGRRATGLAPRMAELLGAPQRELGLIDYRSGDQFRTISMQQVLKWHAEGNTRILQELFKGRPVLLGVVLPLEDRIKAPVPLLASESENARVPGVLVHAQILRSLLNHGYIKPVPSWFISALTILACLCWFGYGFRKNLVYWTLFLMLPAVGLYALWLGYALSPAALLVSAKLAYVARQGLEALRLSHQRTRLTQAFAGHVNPRLLQRVLASDAKSATGDLAPRRQEATAMWVQVPTSLAARAADTPGQATDSLAQYFNAVQQAVQRAGGMVDRFQGTSVLAYFGAPLPLRHPQRAALEAALAIARAQPQWGRPLASPDGALPPLSIGIASGEVLTGQVNMKKGSPFVVLGEAVDAAAWLAAQPLPEGAPSQVLVSPEVAQSVGEAALKPAAAGGVPSYSLAVG